MYRKWLSFTLALVMLLTVFPAHAHAEESVAVQQEQPSESAGNFSDRNNLSEEITTVTYVDVPVKLNAWYDGNVSEAEATEQIRKALVNREKTITVLFRSSNSDYTSASRSVFYNALEHTGEPEEGDYLRWQYGGYSSSISYGNRGSTYYYEVTYSVPYYTTAAQEAELDTAVSKLLDSLDLDGKSDYEKFSAIYQYMCANIEYDYDNLEDDSYDLKYTAYAALINKTAVCQGYANLLYRLMLEVGVDCRLIAGTGNGGGHGWNIVKLGNYYYNVDATWDATWYTAIEEYRYRLRCEANFGDHTRDAEYTTTTFNAAYPMSPSDYSVHNLTATAAKAATCTSAGNSAYWTCSDCGKYFADGNGATEISYGSWVLPAAGHTLSTTYSTNAQKHWKKCTKCSYTTTAVTHTFGQWYVTQEPTCQSAGQKTHDCSVCGYSAAESLPKADHSLTPTAAVAATCTTAGNSAYWTCSDCGKYFSDSQGNTQIAKDSWIIPAHSLQAVPRKAPTATHDGNIAYLVCHTCTKYYVQTGGNLVEIPYADTVIPATGGVVALGDADGDSFVDAYDASLIKKYSVGAISEDALNISVLDLDGDRFVDAYDASLIQKYSVGAITKFPVEN